MVRFDYVARSGVIRGEVRSTIEALEGKGYRSYLQGSCVRRLLEERRSREFVIKSYGELCEMKEVVERRWIAAVGAADITLRVPDGDRETVIYIRSVAGKTAEDVDKETAILSVCCGESLMTIDWVCYDMVRCELYGSVEAFRDISLKLIRPCRLESELFGLEQMLRAIEYATSRDEELKLAPEMMKLIESNKEKLITTNESHQKYSAMARILRSADGGKFYSVLFENGLVGILLPKSISKYSCARMTKWAQIVFDTQRGRSEPLTVTIAALLFPLAHTHYAIDGPITLLSESDFMKSMANPFALSADKRDDLAQLWRTMLLKPSYDDPTAQKLFILIRLFYLIDDGQPRSSWT